MNIKRNIMKAELKKKMREHRITKKNIRDALAIIGLKPSLNNMYKWLMPAERNEEDEIS